MASPHTLEFKKNNPNCCFCNHYYLEFLKGKCALDPQKRKICAKECAYYNPENNNSNQESTK